MKPSRNIMFRSFGPHASRLGLLPVLLLVLTLGSCKQDPEPRPAPNSRVKEQAEALVLVEELTTEVESYVRGVWAYGNTYPACATVTHRNVDDAAGTWYEATLNFGSGTSCPDGSTRSGKIVMRRKVMHRQEAVVRLENYFVDGQKLEGTFSFLQLDEPGKNFAMTATVSDGQILNPDATITQFQLSRKSCWNEGTATPDDISDDITEVFEASYRLALPGKPLATATLTSPLPLIWKRGCQAEAGFRPVQGQVLIELSNRDFGGINFGGGQCGAKPVVD